ncbi:MAG: hypothetical protein JXD23_12720 [Spirochaetales bacterium]|nr:hypothetical protein [Spirochaetales bacterium]
MSTTRSISSPERVPYAVVGGAAKARVRKYLFPLSIVILNRGGRLYRETALDDFAAWDAGEVVSVEGPEAAPDIDLLSKKYPAVRFLLLQAECTEGAKVNLAVEEAQAKLVFVVSSDMHVPLSTLSSRILEKIEARGLLCTLPVLKNPRQETIPSLHVPGFAGASLKLVPWNPLYDGMRSAFAFDYSGIYHKEKFRFSGGYDGALRSPYWQKADFGFRASLWGEELAVNTSVFCRYRRDVKGEDNTPDESYKSFYLKNLAVDFRRDRGVLGYGKFPKYFFKSGSSLFGALAEFRAARRWVWENRYRFKTDARRLVDVWPVPE